MESQYEINKSLLDIISDLSVEVSKLNDSIIINQQIRRLTNITLEDLISRIERLERAINE